MKVKICGITRLEDALYSIKLGADALGFILYPKSKRYIQPIDIKQIISQLPPFVIKVGVFVNEDYKLINRIVNNTGINYVQLHGNESPEYLKKINYPVIKAFRVKDNFDFHILERYKDCYYLLDSHEVNSFGGTGKQFDWQKIPDDIKTKIILAGGISFNDLEFIKKEISPYAVDVSSSVENEPGKKDKDKLAQFLNKINQLREVKC